MPLINMVGLRAALPRGQRLLGLDPGARTIGVALSDVGLMLASPYAGLPRGKLGVVAAALRAIARKEGAAGLVVGYPLSMDGTMGPAAQAARDWARALSDATGFPAALWDERLSSAAVNRMLIHEMDMNRKKRAAVVDGMAAAYILQAALDASTSPTTVMAGLDPAIHDVARGPAHVANPDPPQRGDRTRNPRGNSPSEPNRVDGRDKPGHDDDGRDKPGHDDDGRDKPGHDDDGRDKPGHDDD